MGKMSGKLQSMSREDTKHRDVAPRFLSALKMSCCTGVNSLYSLPALGHILALLTPTRVSHRQCWAPQLPVISQLLHGGLGQTQTGDPAVKIATRPLSCLSASWQLRSVLLCTQVYIMLAAPSLPRVEQMAPVKRSRASYKNHRDKSRGVSTATSHPAPEPILICTAAMCCRASPSQAVSQQHAPQLLSNLELLRKGSSLWTRYLELHCYIKEVIYPITLSSSVNLPLTQREQQKEAVPSWLEDGRLLCHIYPVHLGEQITQSKHSPSTAAWLLTGKAYCQNECLRL